MNQESTDRNVPKQSPFLRAILSGKTRTITNRVRVSPLIAPYRRTDVSNIIKQSKQAPANDHPEKEWFNNYE